MDNKVKRSSNINISVGLDKDNIPVEIKWKAEDDPSGSNQQECKAMLLSIFDKASQDTMKIDLWTTEMQVKEMDQFFYQSLRALADTYLRATKNEALAEDMKRFAQYFGEQTSLMQKK